MLLQQGFQLVSALAERLGRVPEIICRMDLHVYGREFTSSSMKSVIPVVKSHY